MFGSKFSYNARGILNLFIPRFLYRQQLESKLLKGFRDFNNLAYLKTRLNYYCKLQHPFSLPTHTNQNNNIQQHTNSPKSPCFTLLKNHKHSKDYASTYFFDSYEWTRYFNDNLYLAYQFGDVNYTLNAPAITKTRPINDPLCINSILMQLEKQRHFQFINDPINYEDKKDILLFRGAAYQPHRLAFFERYFNARFCDLGHVGNGYEQYKKPKISKAQHLPYKFLLSLEGFDVASNLKWVLSSNSLCVMPKPKFESWFMEGRLVGGEHYCEIKDDYSDVEEKINYYKARPNEAKEIIKNAHNFCNNFMDKRIEAWLNLLVLRKYFYLSRQIDISNIEKEFMDLS